MNLRAGLALLWKRKPKNPVAAAAVVNENLSQPDDATQIPRSTAPISVLYWQGRRRQNVVGLRYRDNAIKYCKKKPEVTIETSNIGKSLIVVVADKGIGIKKEYQTKVFDKFFRVPTNDVHDVKGFGLGLAYIKKIVELHGGDIAYGNKFHLYFSCMLW